MSLQEFYPTKDWPYYRVKEEFKFKSEAVYPVGRYNNLDKATIIFAFDNKGLDKFLREQADDKGENSEHINKLVKRSIFRESLDLLPEHIEILVNADEKTLKKQIAKLCKPYIEINSNTTDKFNVELLGEYGLAIAFDFKDFKKQPAEDPTNQIFIEFYMPKRWGTLLEVAIVEPTKNAKIEVEYDENTMQLDAYPFLTTKNSTSNKSALHPKTGRYTVFLDKEWILPMSGIIFQVNRKEKIKNKKNSKKKKK